MHGGDWNDEKNRKAHSAIDVDGCVDPFAAVVESLATGSLRLCCNALFACRCTREWETSTARGRLQILTPLSADRDGVINQQEFLSFYSVGFIRARSTHPM